MANNAREIVTEAFIDEYKGHPVLRIPTGGGYSLGLGLAKAQAVLEHLEVIEAFVESKGKSIDP
jgi:hypothetical protein